MEHTVWEQNLFGVWLLSKFRNVPIMWNCWQTFGPTNIKWNGDIDVRSQSLWRFDRFGWHGIITTLPMLKLSRVTRDPSWGIGCCSKSQLLVSNDWNGFPSSPVVVQAPSDVPAGCTWEIREIYILLYMRLVNTYIYCGVLARMFYQAKAWMFYSSIKKKEIF